MEGLVAFEFYKAVGREGGVVTNAAYRGERCHMDCDTRSRGGAEVAVVLRWVCMLANGCVG